MLKLSVKHFKTGIIKVVPEAIKQTKLLERYSNTQNIWKEIKVENNKVDIL